MNPVEGLLQEALEYATAGSPTRADTLRMSRRLYRALHSPPVDLGSGDSVVRLLDVSLRIRDAIDRGLFGAEVVASREELVSLLAGEARPKVIRSMSPGQPLRVELSKDERLNAIRASAVDHAPAGDRHALVAACAFGYAVLDCSEPTRPDSSSNNEVNKRTEELVHQVRFLIIENDELKNWIEHVELHRKRVEGNLQSAIRDLRQRVRELEGYVIALESSLYQSQADPTRIVAAVQSTKTSSQTLVTFIQNIMAGLAVVGLTAGTGFSTAPIGPTVAVTITNSCDRVLDAILPPANSHED